MCEFLASAVDEPPLTSIVGKITMVVNGVHQLFGYRPSSKYLILCSARERNSYRFETTSG